MTKEIQLTAETRLEAKMMILQESIARTEEKLARDRRKLRELVLKNI